MSIIQEALKKAQRYKDARATVKKEVPLKVDIAPGNEAAAQKNILPPFLSKSAKRRFNFAPAAAIVIVIALISAVFAARAFRPENKRTAVEPTTSHQEISYKPLTPQQETPKAQAAAPAVTEDAAPKKAAEPPPPIAVRPDAGQGYPDFVLNGIMYLADGSQAIINNSMVTAGDTVSGATVVRINRNSVILNYNNTEITLTLKK